MVLIHQNVKLLPFCYCIVVNVLCNLAYHRGAKLILYVGQEEGSVEGLVRSIGLLKRLFGVDVIGEPYGNADRQFALRSVAVHTDGTLREVVADDGAFEFEIATFAEDLEARLTLIEIAYLLREGVAQRRVDHRRVVREVRDADRVRGLVVDVGAVELETDRAAAHNEQQQTAHEVCCKTADAVRPLRCKTALRAVGFIDHIL